MYTISNGYKNLLETSLSLSPKSKIVVDGTIYDGSVIKTYPKISHKNSKMIGGFPTKTCTFDIYDVNGNLDFEGKEITIYRGLDINGTTEWIPQGIFIPTADKITTDISTKTISFSGIQDKSQLFDTLYTTNLNWLDGSTHTGLEIVQDICGTLGITLETTTFNWYNYSFKQPNFPSNITYREVISRLAEIGGSIAYISRTGGLVIKSQTSTGHSIARKRYSKLTREKQFGQITVVVLGKDGMDDDIVYPATLPDNVIEWKILDNPFVDLYREEMIETVASYIIGQSIIPFTLTDFVDGFYLDLNDTAQVTDRNNNTFTAIILNYESTSRIKASVGADTQTETQTNYQIAGSVKESIRNVSSQVDHINGTITDIVSEIGDRSEKSTTITQDIDSISQQVSSSITLTKDVSNISYVTVEDAFEANVSKLSIVGEMSLLYPRDDLYPSDDLYPLDSYLVIEDEDGNKNKILLPITYLHYLNADVYDEFIIENGQARIIRRVGENDDGSLYALTTETAEDKGACEIPLNTGYNKIYLESFSNKSLRYNLKYVYQNDYTDTFATKVELNTTIEQTATNINLSVNQRLENYSTTQEMNAAIELSASQINLSVANKVDKDEVIAQINLTSETAKIIASKIQLEGLVTANSNFKILLDGSIEAVNGKFSGTITADSGTIGGAGIDSQGVFFNSGNNGWGLWGTTNHANIILHAGANTSNIGGAPFRVLNDGTVYATKANITGAITATSGKIAGFNIGSDRLYYGNTAINRNGNVEFRNDNGYFAIGSNSVNLHGSGMQHPVTISDMLANSGTGDVNASIGIRAYYGNINISSNEYTVVKGASGVYINNQFYSGSSSINTKENLKPLTNKQIVEIYEVLKNLDIYQYDYKKKYGGRKNNIGFLVEDIENTALEKYLHVYKDEEDKNRKSYNNEDLIKAVLIALQELMKRVDKNE